MSLRELVTDAACAPDGGAGSSSSVAVNPAAALSRAVLDGPPGLAGRSLLGRGDANQRARSSTEAGVVGGQGIVPSHYDLLLSDQPGAVDNAALHRTPRGVEHVPLRLSNGRSPNGLVDDFLAANAQENAAYRRPANIPPRLPRYFPRATSTQLGRVPPSLPTSVTSQFEAAFAGAAASTQMRRQRYIPPPSPRQSPTAGMTVQPSGAIRATSAYPVDVLGRDGIAMRSGDYRAEGVRTNRARTAVGPRAEGLDEVRADIPSADQDQIRRRAYSAARQHFPEAEDSYIERQVHEFMESLADHRQNPVVRDREALQADHDWESAFERLAVSGPAREISEQMAARSEERMHASALKSLTDSMAGIDGSSEWASSAGGSALQEGTTVEQAGRSLSTSWSEEFTSLEAHSETTRLRVDEASEHNGDRFDALVGDDLARAFEDTFEADLHDYLQRDPALSPYEFAGENQFSGVSAQQALREGIRLRNEGKLSLAAEAFESAVTNKSGGLTMEETTQAWFLLGTTHAECDDDLRAIQALSRCVGDAAETVMADVSAPGMQNPFAVDARLALAVCYTNELNDSMAIENMRRWLDSKGIPEASFAPESSAHDPLGDDAVDSILSSGQSNAMHASVLRRLERAALGRPDDADLHIAIGVMHNLGRDYAKAADALRMAVAMRPNDARLWNKLGATLANGSESDDALRAYRKAVDISPTFIRAWVNVGTAYANRGNYEKAARYYLKSLSLHAEGTGGADLGASESRPGPSSEPRVGLANQGAEMGHVWGYLRTALVAMQRDDLLPLADRCDPEAFKAYVPY